MSEDDGKKWHAYPAKMWALSMAINLPVPLFFATAIYVSEGKWPYFGAIGVFLACVSLMGSGFYFAGFRSEAMRRITNGGFIVATTQLFPILQVMAGAFAIGLWDGYIRPYLPPLPAVRLLEGYAITFIVGQALMFVALSMGFLLKNSEYQVLKASYETRG
jgi:hypothetical protein